MRCDGADHDGTSETAAASAWCRRPATELRSGLPGGVELATRPRSEREAFFFGPPVPTPYPPTNLFDTRSRYAPLLHGAGFLRSTCAGVLQEHMSRLFYP